MAEGSLTKKARQKGSLTLEIGSRKNSALQHSRGLRLRVSRSAGIPIRCSGGTGAGGKYSSMPLRRACSAGEFSKLPNDPSKSREAMRRNPKKRARNQQTGPTHQRQVSSKRYGAWVPVGVSIALLLPAQTVATAGR